MVKEEAMAARPRRRRDFMSISDADEDFQARIKKNEERGKIDERIRKIADQRIDTSSS